MKTCNTYYSNEASLSNFLQKNSICDDKNILIQIFTELSDKDKILNILNSVKTLLPSAKIIGTTTDGEISNGKVSTNKTVLSITLFDKTTIYTAIIKRGKSDKVGARLASKIIKKKSKVIIVFSNGLHTNGDDFLDEINDIDSNIIVAGGMCVYRESKRRRQSKNWPW